MASFKKQLNNWRTLRSWRPYFLIFVIGFLLYGQTLFFDFTYFDDNELILNKIAVLKDFKNVGEIFSNDVFFSINKFYYRPLLNLSFMFDAQLGGELPFFYHLSNIFFHLLAAMLVFCLLKKISQKTKLSFFFSLVFLVHPVLTQAVAWVAGRNDSLLAIFVLAAFIFFLNFSADHKLRQYLAYLFCFLLALFTKETAIFLPILLIFYFLFIDKKSLDRSEKCLLILGSAVGAVIWFLARSLALGQGSINYLTAILGVLKNLPALFLNVGKIILPINLSVLPILEDSSLVCGIIVSLLLFIAWLFSKKKRLNYSLFGLTWFLLFLFPSFIRLNDLPDFLEHRLYLPIIGFFIILMEIDWIKNLDFTKKKIKIMAVIILLIFSVLTLRHSKNFYNRLTFWHSAAESSVHSPLAQRNLGAMYYLDGRLDLAIEYYNKALALNPEEAMVHNNLGLIYLEQKLYKQAEEEFKKELSFYPNYDKALFNLGSVYYQTGRQKEGRELWQRALEVNPYYYEAYAALLNSQNRLR